MTPTALLLIGCSVRTRIVQIHRSDSVSGCSRYRYRSAGVNAQNATSLSCHIALTPRNSEPGACEGYLSGDSLAEAAPRSRRHLGEVPAIASVPFRVERIIRRDEGRNPRKDCGPRPELLRESDHSTILVTRPAPTVRPPSRMAKRRPSSMATGWMSSTDMSVLSPGMTISVPSGSVMTPVTSVVRK
jgi:hypothetical protein